MTQDRFYRAYALLRVHEGGYSNHPKDPGGATMKGVTQRTYDDFRVRREQRPQHVRQISDSELEAVYRGQYWDAVHADELPPGVAYCVFDAAVNSGPSRAVRWLQKVVGAKVDGIVGNNTITMVQGMKPELIIEQYCDRRLAFMKRLKHWATFKNGWTQRVAEVRAQSLEWAEKDHVVTVSTQSPQPKAEGKESISATVMDTVKDKGALTAVGGVLGSIGSLASGRGPIQYAVAIILVLAVLTAIWWIIKGREA